MPSTKLTLRHRRALLDRLIEQPSLLDRVQELAASQLARAIRHIGLEDAGALLALASAAQLGEIFDEELWVSDAPGVDESFDAQRFGLWLTVLLESGVAFTVQKLLALDEDFLVLALSHHILVIDVEQLAVSMSRGDRSDDDDLLDKQLESTLYMELEEYRVIAKHEQHWESICAILSELNEQHFTELTRILGRCVDLSETYIEDHGGLSEVLSEAEALADEVAGSRADRREQQGYVAPSSARAFLGLCLQSDEQTLWAAREPDAITRAHFRVQPSERPAARLSAAPLLTRGGTDPLLELLVEAEQEASRDEPSPRRLTAPLAKKRAVDLQQLLTALRTDEPALYDKLALQLAYLANVLLAGHEHEGRRLRPGEALQAALEVCERGVQRAKKLEASSKRAASALLREHGLVKLFQLGFKPWLRPTKRAAGA